MWRVEATRKNQVLKFAALAFGVLATVAIAYAKFYPCRVSSFATEALLTKSCYSDIPVFWSLKELEINPWAYKADQAVEYPVIIGLFISLLAFYTPGRGIPSNNFYDLNALFLAFSFIVTATVLKKVNKRYWLCFAFCPIIGLALFMNWDVLALLFAIPSVYFFDKRRFRMSGFFLGIAISAKFFPVVLIIPALAILIKNKTSIKMIGDYVFSTILTWAVINLPIALTSFDGWSLFYRTSLSRGTGDGSLWQALEILGVSISNLNIYYALSTIVIYGCLITYIWRESEPITLSAMAFWALFAFMFFNKVYSPQFAIWVAGFAVMAIRSRKHLLAFFTWQLIEITYHFSIWQYYLGRNTEGLSGISPEIYLYTLTMRYVGLTLLFLTLYSRKSRVVSESLS
jgi:hypothetical protein